MNRNTRFLTVATTAALTLSSFATSTQASTTASESDARTITWIDCAELPGFTTEERARFHERAECGTIKTPLDYSDPNSELISVGLLRIRATAAAKRQGVVFYNPGGPGSSAIMKVTNTHRNFSPEFQQSFDLIAVDPRGTNGTIPFNCGTSPSSAYIPNMPLQAGDAVRMLNDDRDFRAACADRMGKTGPFLSTADVVRDHEEVRKALGETTVNYFGVSYGTYVATTYANMFPQSLRAVVADSAMDPVAYRDGHGIEGVTMTPFARLRSAAGAGRGLEAIFALCEQVGEPKCPVAKTIRADWEYLTTRGHETKFTLHNGPEMPYDKLIMTLARARYNAHSEGFLLSYIKLFADQARVANGDLVGALGSADTAETKHLQAQAQEIFDQNQDMPGFNNGTGPINHGENRLQWMQSNSYGVMCSEMRAPQDPTAAISTEAHMTQLIAGEGALRAWQTSACSHWPMPAKNVYRGAFNKPDAAAVLILNNEYDPATTLMEGAQPLHRLLPKSRLVTVVGEWGHISTRFNQCARQAAEDYFFTAELPAQDVTCQSEINHFP